MKVFFASSSNFGEVVLKKVIDGGLVIDCLITFSDKKFGRGQEKKPLPIKSFALQKEMRVREIDTVDDFHQVVKEENPEVVVVAGFGIIINKETLEESTFINVHPSLLPKYRGATPIQKSIVNGDSVMGVSIIAMSNRLDQGPVIKEQRVDVSSNIDYLTAENLLANIAGEMLVGIIPQVDSEKKQAKKQNEEMATYTKKLTKEDGLINWKEPAIVIERKIRGYNPWPGSYSYLNGKMIKIFKAKVQEQTEAGPFGIPGKTYLGTNATLAVQTGRDFLLIEKLQEEGKRPVITKEFLQGNFSLIGSVFNSQY